MLKKYTAMKKTYIAPAIQVIKLEITKPILAGSYGSQTISDKEPDYGYDFDNTGIGFIGFGEGECEEPE